MVKPLYPTNFPLGLWTCGTRSDTASNHCITWKSMCLMRFRFFSDLGPLQVQILIATLYLQQGSLIDRKSQRIAFRRAIIVEDKLIDQEGLTWLFEINGVRIFCGGTYDGLFVLRVAQSCIIGSNWIPGDSFLTTSVFHSELLPANKFGKFFTG